MTVKHGHNCLEDASNVVHDAFLSRETRLRSASTAFKHQCEASTDGAKNKEPKRRRVLLGAIVTSRRLLQRRQGESQKLSDTLAAIVHGRSRKTWEGRFDNGDEPTQVVTFVRWFEHGLVLVRRPTKPIPSSGRRPNSDRFVTLRYIPTASSS
ncbi:BZ3500_MvSof-1268-A1-R1_Chr4-2g07118 [Microbotryum saponariae]|uniref:BZ3500_MvSof-1268-A1-R1_Chr4-2g07118 protein n=1 Tax=Microbotryum saponariae TaxID=289078 RepID=A0A2X0MX12_9BASI|nr:BZ3500_MvSof-1268-A1-R1_Chr4-2g07118 [Microbotryum saponariae]SDA06783.1 BZ3501_MvSof-1269-A2-R1_Chr4-2g06829 [Microbotryum saponariae]